MRNLILRLVPLAIFVFYGVLFQELNAQNSHVVKWLKNSSGSKWDYLSELEIDCSGNLFAVGNFTGTMKIIDCKEKSEGENDIFIIKYNPDGKVDWLNTIKSDKYCYVGATCVDNSGALIISGYFGNKIVIGETTITGIGSKNAFIVKLDNSGQLDWWKTLHGDFGSDPLLLRTDSLNNIFFAGSYSNLLTMDSLVLKGDYFADIFILTLNIDGKLLCNHTFKGKGIDVVKDMVVTEKSIYIAGYFENDISLFDSTIFSKGRFDAFFLKYMRDSSQVLIRQLGSAFDDYGTSINVDHDANIVLAGVHSGQISIGNNFKLTSNGKLDAFICKYNSDGEVIWAYNFGGLSNEYLSTAVIDSIGDIYLTGNYRGSIYKKDYKILSNKLSEDIFIAKYNANSGLKYIESIGDSTTELGKSLLLGKTGNLFLAGNIYMTKDILDTKLDSINGNNFLLANLFDCSSIREIKLPNDTSLCEESFTIVADTGYLTYVWNSTKGEYKYTVDTSGQYNVRVTDINGCESNDTIMVLLHVPRQVSIGNDVQVERGEIVTLTPDNEYKTYLWSTDAKEKSINLNTLEMVAGEYWFTLIVADTNNCKSTDNIMVSILEPNHLNEFSLLIYPNPVKEKFNFNINNIDIKSDLDLKLVTQLGTVVWSNNYNFNNSDFSGEIEVASFNPGIYIFFVRNGNKSIEQTITIL